MLVLNARPPCPHGGRRLVVLIPLAPAWQVRGAHLEVVEALCGDPSTDRTVRDNEGNIPADLAGMDEHLRLALKVSAHGRRPMGCECAWASTNGM